MASSGCVLVCRASACPDKDETLFSLSAPLEGVGVLVERASQRLSKLTSSLSHPAAIRSQESRLPARESTLSRGFPWSSEISACDSRDVRFPLLSPTSVSVCFRAEPGCARTVLCPQRASCPCAYLCEPRGRK